MSDAARVPVGRVRTYLAACTLAIALAAGPAVAADGGAPAPTVLAAFYEAPAYLYDPGYFAVRGSAYGLSGYGYYYDQPTEHRLGGQPRRWRAAHRRSRRG